ncbi:MAG: sigma-54-dependent Fis family transcriptional regulator [Clostridium tyrobutyricum]|jgi:PAS domain S-box-containing protein|uniref:sigma 54-interacting transcriptional regulator n=1 Tax=Clostridium tyrobutyricum TaxID=1519 RepID=UPI00057D91F3|nr:sigma 54-interacting transcriptional regulator [Clostridium tyrobutyricum]MBV4431426.1 sigma-54-dependent Fis family transcriptional regulator [Clostridium tyrobutyricum]MBV4440884.1 sigma-54-dependent Fis family transcriptional regulator [Clostridium tyrobutyricum]MCH4199487.1 sigma-54-dependent Fis family transcriptional regulator [Clostridium tyrobutyricum]MCH4236900.1 sigma-54-dependent Fis family transcriptional regulator [Clostridium tyrobutyricum]MCH4258792.1 sigma-54-dependent Fis f
MYKNTIKVPIPNGIHTRIAATVVHRAVQLKNKYGINLYIKTLSTKEPLAVSMLALVSLKIRENEAIEVSCAEDIPNGKMAVKKLCDFITKDLVKNNLDISKIDDIIEENTIAYEQIVENIPVGIVVIDKNGRITTMNDYALKIANKSLSEVIGRFIKDIIPTSDLTNVLKIMKRKVGETQYINNNLVISNRSPIFSNNTVIGALGVFQDISDLVGIKELNERFKKILEASHELICFVDDRRIISYINPAYEKHYKVKSEDIVGKDLIDISPNGIRIKVFNSKNTIKDMVYHKDNKTIVSTVAPIFADGKFKGVISISRTADELKDLLNKLRESEEKLNFYKEELNRHNKISGSFDSIIGYSSSLKECLIIAEKASKSTSTVLIRGESGTGKELIAKAIHNNSNRKNEPFVRINCAAIPENLFESELFGYEKGAFTGALKSKPGKFTLANKGTIFLDEIGDMPVSMQVKLLRVLQEREFESVGGLTTHKVDVRIIAATNKNLEEMLKTNKFREDLYYRLNVINILLPPLRNRKEDINLLVEHFIKKLNKRLNKNIQGIGKNLLSYLQEYRWPGNIRELENIVERAMNMCDGNIIKSKDLPFYIKSENSEQESLINLKDGNLATIQEYEKEIITKAMEKYKSYNKTGKILGLTHRTISLKCKKYGINVSDTH